MSSLIISTPFALGVVVNISVFYRSRTPIMKSASIISSSLSVLIIETVALSKGIVELLNSLPTDLIAFRARSILCVEFFTFSILIWVRLTIMTTALPHSASQTSPVSSTSILLRAHAYYGRSSTNTIGVFVHIVSTRGIRRYASLRSRPLEASAVCPRVHRERYRWCLGYHHRSLTLSLSRRSWLCSFAVLAARTTVFSLSGTTAAPSHAMPHTRQWTAVRLLPSCMRARSARAQSPKYWTEADSFFQAKTFWVSSNSVNHVSMLLP